MIDAVPCQDVVHSWTGLSHGEINAFVAELSINPYYLCPDVDEIEVFGAELSTTKFYLQIYYLPLAVT